jgi:type II secretory pathway component GspD/PulD (secretin)
MKWCKVKGTQACLSVGRSTTMFAAGFMLIAADVQLTYAQQHAQDGGRSIMAGAAGADRERTGLRDGAQNGVRPGEGYVAHDAPLDQVLEALASVLGKPVVPSAKARRKKVSGEFDLAHPRSVLERVCADLGLVTYFDGHVIHVYDASELTNAVGSLRSIDVRTLLGFLRKSGLYADRFPINGDADAHTFYVAGPPVYVDAVLAAAKHLDREERIAAQSGEDVVKVIALNHTFVRDRAFKLRDQEIRVPGIATVLAEMLGERTNPARVVPTASGAVSEVASAAEPERRARQALNATSNGLPPLPYILPGSGMPHDTQARPDLPPLGLGVAQAIQISSQPSVLAYPDTNSLLIKGSREEVEYLSELVEQLDIEKTQIELSLWIIDLSYRSLEQLGIRWQAGLRLGSLGATFNAPTAPVSGALSTLDGARFLASVFAMSKTGNAQVVSRPLILTQENVPAIFDNNRTFYAKLIGERTTSLDRITYGTLVSVIPRLSADHAEIEMILDIEDGDTESINGGDVEVDGLPIVGRTHINTIARVPRELSLLIGGYTRHAENTEQSRIPLLGDIPLIGNLFRYSEWNGEDVVRVFLIQPRVLPRRAVWDGEGFRDVPQLSPSMTIRQGTALLDQAVRGEMRAETEKGTPASTSQESNESGIPAAGEIAQ